VHTTASRKLTDNHPATKRRRFTLESTQAPRRISIRPLACKIVVWKIIVAKRRARRYGALGSTLKLGRLA
jgi:hypothetical protein